VALARLAVELATLGARVLGSLVDRRPVRGLEREVVQPDLVAVDRRRAALAQPAVERQAAFDRGDDEIDVVDQRHAGCTVLRPE
jgi:hypothetical protein